MSNSGYIELVEIPTRPEPVMPGACQTGGCGSGPENPRVQAAPPSFGTVRVNGVVIDPEAIAREIQHHPSADGEAAWQAASRALVLRELLLQEARRLDLIADPEADESGATETQEDALVRALLEQQLQPPEVGELECRRYYNSHSHRFRTSELIEASHILIEPEGTDESAWATAEARARVIAENLGNAPEAFATAAREHSTCPTAQQGGSLGQVRRGELVAAVQTALDQLPEGTTGSEPVRSRFGFHVLRLQRKLPGRTLPYEIVKDKIAQMLEARAWSIAAGQYAASLTQAAVIEGISIEPAQDGGPR